MNLRNVHETMSRHTRSTTGPTVGPRHKQCLLHRLTVIGYNIGFAVPDVRSFT